MQNRFTDRSFELLAELSANNNREWYTAHKHEIEACLLSPMAETLEAITRLIADKEMAYRGGRDTLFRMNRDTRFSKDKSPYKTSVSGLLTPGGDKDESAGIIYLQIDSYGGFAAFGRYNLDAGALGPIRDRMLSETGRLQKILSGLQSQGLGLFRDAGLKSMPRGYSEYADHALADELKLTSMMVKLELPKKLWTSGKVVKRISDVALDCRDFISFVSV